MATNKKEFTEIFRSLIHYLFKDIDDKVLGSFNHEIH